MVARGMGSAVLVRPYVNVFSTGAGLGSIVFSIALHLLSAHSFVGFDQVLGSRLRGYPVGIETIKYRLMDAPAVEHRVGVPAKEGRGTGRNPGDESAISRPTDDNRGVPMPGEQDAAAARI